MNAMTHDEIIKLVEKAGIDQMTWFHKCNEIERFAALVAAAEREACAEICDNWELGRDDICLVADEIRARGEG